MVVVEVRQGTLGVDGRGWGPAENTVDRGSQLDEEDEDDEDDKDDKDDKEDEEDEEERRRRRTRQEEATDIKSNNPHLAGGEKPYYRFPPFYSVEWFSQVPPVYFNGDIYTIYIYIYSI